MKRLSNILKENKEFILASGAYLVGSGIDYASTTIGIEAYGVREVNPIIQNFISEFGTHGILVPKFLLSTMTIIPPLKYVDNKNASFFWGKIKFKFKAKYVLYTGAILTAATGLSWMVEKYLV